MKYEDVGDEEELGLRLEEVWLWGTKLKVNKARFGREKKQVEEVKKLIKVVDKGTSKVAPGTSYINVLNGQTTDQREEEFCLELQPSGEMLEWLEGAFVRELHQDLEAREVLHRMLMEGLSNVRVTTMGVKMMLMQFDGRKDLDSVKKNHQLWWDAMFSKVIKWNPQKVAFRRKVWLKVHGIPLHVWDEQLFKNIGAHFGSFVDFDEVTITRKRLDVAKILVTTDRMGMIDETVKLVVMGATHRIWVVEEGGVGRCL